MKTKNQIIISLALAALMIIVGLSPALATESAWQNLNPSFESGLSGTVNNCNPLTVSNGSVAAYPTCTITCNSGYTLSGNSCNANSNGGGGGGGSSAPVTVINTIGSASMTAPMVVDNTQTGNLSQPLTGGAKVDLVVPQGAVSTATTFSATTGSLTSAMTPVNTTGALMVGGQVFNITATSGGTAVRNFSGNLTVTLTVPNQPNNTSNLGVYYFNDTTSEWILVPGAVFNSNNDTVTFQVNHLTKFAVFNIAGKPAKIAVATTVTPPVTEPETTTPVVTPPASSTAFVALEKSLVKKISQALVKRLSGRILLQTEGAGQAWYVNPVNGTKYFLGYPADAFAVMRKLGLGVSNKTFATFKNGKAPSKLAGRILLKVEDKGMAYYVNPVDLKLHYLGRPSDAFSVMRTLGLGVSNTNLRQINVSEIK